MFLYFTIPSIYKFLFFEISPFIWFVFVPYLIVLYIYLSFSPISFKPPVLAAAPDIQNPPFPTFPREPPPPFLHPHKYIFLIPFLATFLILLFYVLHLVIYSFQYAPTFFTTSLFFYCYSNFLST